MARKLIQMWLKKFKMKNKLPTLVFVSLCFVPRIGFLFLHIPFFHSFALSTGIEYELNGKCSHIHHLYHHRKWCGKTENENNQIMREFVKTRQQCTVQRAPCKFWPIRNGYFVILILNFQVQWSGNKVNSKVLFFIRMMMSLAKATFRNGA